MADFPGLSPQDQDWLKGLLAGLPHPPISGGDVAHMQDPLGPEYEARLVQLIDQAITFCKPHCTSGEVATASGLSLAVHALQVAASEDSNGLAWFLVSRWLYSALSVFWADGHLAERYLQDPPEFHGNIHDARPEGN
jgi:hypothetical protein